MSPADSIPAEAKLEYLKSRGWTVIDGKIIDRQGGVVKMSSLDHAFDLARRQRVHAAKERLRLKKAGWYFDGEDWTHDDISIYASREQAIAHLDTLKSKPGASPGKTP